MASMRELLKNAVMAKIAAASALTSLLSGGYHWGEPGPIAAKPYIKIDTLGGGRLQAMKTCKASSGSVVIFINIFSDGGSTPRASTEAEAIQSAVHTLFDMQPITMAGYKNMTLWRPEEDDLRQEPDTGLWHCTCAYQGRANPIPS